MSFRKRGKHAYQVRVPGFPARTVPTLRAAKELDLQLKLRRSMGELHVEKATTLGDEIDALDSYYQASAAPRPGADRGRALRARLMVP